MVAATCLQSEPRLWFVWRDKSCFESSHSSGEELVLLPSCAGVGGAFVALFKQVTARTFRVHVDASCFPEATADVHLLKRREWSPDHPLCSGHGALDGLPNISTPQ